MSGAVNCAAQVVRHVYTKAEVLAHGWAWHAGTAPLIEGAIVLSLAVPCPPALAVPPPVPIPPVTPAYVAPPPAGGGWAPMGSGDGDWWVAPLPDDVIPAPEAFLPPVEEAGEFVTPPVVIGWFPPTDHHHSQGCPEGMTWNGHSCVDECQDNGGGGSEVSEPSALLLLLMAAAGVVVATRRSKS